MLPEIVKAVNGRCEIYLDGGICRGTDVFKVRPPFAPYNSTIEGVFFTSICLDTNELFLSTGSRSRRSRRVHRKARALGPCSQGQPSTLCLPTILATAQSVT